MTNIVICLFYFWNMRYYYLFLSIAYCFIGHELHAAYAIKGRVNLGEEWQPKVFMAAVEKLGDYYRASAELVISVAAVNKEGYFSFEGNNLPEDDRFYRLYLMKEQNSDYDACLYVGGDDHNFIHLILNNNSIVEVKVDSNYISPFGNYRVLNSTQNESLRSLAKMVYPSFEFYKFRFPTALKLSEERLQEDLKQFMDTCSYPLVALAAAVNTDFDSFYEKDKDFYFSFAERLEEELAYSTYTNQYIRKLQFYQGEPIQQMPLWGYLLISLLSMGLVIQFWQIRKQQQLLLEWQAQENTTTQQTRKLTNKELEILKLVELGKSNKEIAGELFISLSTVKSHLNKIYQKLEVNNRREAAEMAKKQEY